MSTNFAQEMQDKLQEAIKHYGLAGVHPAATIVPMMILEEYQDLVRDVEEKGLMQDILITEEKLLLDGRNRLCVLMDLGEEAEFEVYTPNDPIGLVLSLNTRRSLTQSQRAMMALKVEELYAEEAKARKLAGKKVDPKADLPEGSTKGQARDKAAKTTGASARLVSDAKALAKADPELSEKVWHGEITLNAAMKSIKNRKKAESKSKDTSDAKGANSIFNTTNDNIGWALKTWNVITGCDHKCDGCYARDIANRFYDEGFEPTFRPERLSAPKTTPVPKDDDPASRRVFTGSMGDQWGKWVPSDQIQQVLDACEDAPQWTFLFLTQNSQRYLEFEFPENCWLGITCNTQAKMKAAAKIIKKLRAKGIKNVIFISCEPLDEPVRIPEGTPVDQVIIGARSKTTELPASQPEWEWVEDLLMDSRREGAKVYFKENLTVQPKESPED